MALNKLLGKIGQGHCSVLSFAAELLGNSFSLHFLLDIFGLFY